MESYFGFLESSLIGIPMPLRQVFILASRKLMGRIRDHRLIDAYTATLLEMFLASPKSERGYVQALELCIEAYGVTLANFPDRRLAV